MIASKAARRRARTLVTPGSGPVWTAYRNGQRAGTHGRNRASDRANNRRKAIQEASQ
jgi:hypothetical protein